MWYKDDKPLATGRNVRIRTWAKRLRKRRKSLGRRTRSPALVRGRVESNERRRPLVRNLRRRHPHNRQARTSEGGRRRAGKESRRERVGRRENAERKRRLKGKRHERQRRIGRDGRRRLLPTTSDDALSPVTRRQQADAERWSGDRGQAADSSSTRRLGGRRVRPPSNPSRRVVQVSEVKVRAASARDAGQYKCVARSVVGQADIEASIRVVQPIDPHTLVDKCPYDGYCLNGGTCMMFTVVGELVCQCAEGFKGQRCQEKEVYPTFMLYSSPFAQERRRRGYVRGG